MISLVPVIAASLEQFSCLEPLRQKIAALNLTEAPYLLAIGKTAVLMAKVCCNALQEKGFNAEGYLLAKYGMGSVKLPGITCLEAGHPTPDANSLANSHLIVDWLKSLDQIRTLIVLISGGASALFEIPAKDYDLDALVELNRRLLASGLPISEMNRRRAEYSQVKAGKALEMVPCREIRCFALSDVEGNNPQVIGSGSFFCSDAAETQPGEYQAILTHNRCFTYSIVGDNLAWRKQLGKLLKPPVKVYHQFVNKTVEDWAEWLSRFALKSASRGVHIFGGEAVVQVQGDGLGGRCTHLALLVAKQISGLPGVGLIAVASDGNDNLDGVSGARVDGSSWEKLKAQGIDPDLALARFDSYPALQAIDAIIPAWKTPVNVNELYLLYLE